MLTVFQKFTDTYTTRNHFTALWTLFTDTDIKIKQKTESYFKTVFN